jgi:xanthine/CO dehydrogenase XdhC/CoxF family maturation factor
VARGEEAVAAAPLEARALVVVMTHRYLDDLPILRALLPRPLAYLGLLGPKKRAEKILADLAREGCALASEQSARLHAPVGLDLGGATPEEVALAILAEMQAVRWQRDARPLRGRTRPIHHD